ncbi:hypothetical protein [Streptomyces sp. NBC_00083]|uniref:hypothetical protein n=1 Tax=Streptomyces sp. NBC_00083 TaxID=2975647 RepID=UPI002253E1B6|nr:hypothetical protein [Streptomyces sp. NBC_00083]MCX5383171.1 hypothetical protein [Streptomyces sp. NBC_00083]
MPLTQDTPGPARRILRASAIAACLPYIALKILWAGGSHLGIPDGSVLLEHRARTAVGNSGSVLMDGCVIVLALLLTRPWGLRVKAWLLVVPMWLATGLLAPVMTGYPLQLLVRALGGNGVRPPDDGSAAFLHEWVFAVVYTGFIVQGIALGALFTLYARDRWGHLWSGRVGEAVNGPGAAPPASRPVALAVATLSLLPAVTHTVWATGSAAGMTPSLASGRGADQYVLEAVFAAFTVPAAAGVLILALGFGGSLALRVPLALAWLGSGATACWGGWLWLSSSVLGAGAADRPTPLMNLTYAVQMITGLAVAALGARFLAARSRRPDSPAGTP